MIKASEIAAAADSVAQWAEHNKAIVDVGIVLGKLGSVVQAVEENDRKLAEVRAAVVNAKADLASLKNLAAEAVEDKDRIVGDANEKANKVVSDAAVAGAKTISDAESEAQKIKAVARSEAAQVLSSARANVAKMKAEADRWEGARAASAAARDAALAELVATEGKIAKLREQFTRILAA